MTDKDREIKEIFRVAATLIKWRDDYVDLLKTMVFADPPSHLYEKEKRKYENFLKDYDCLSLFFLVWKESLTDEELTRLEITRSPFPLNAHRLAVELAESPKDVAKTTSYIRTFSLAASAYGLINRAAERSTLVKLEPTPLLHRFLAALVKRNSADPCGPIARR